MRFLVAFWFGFTEARRHRALEQHRKALVEKRRLIAHGRLLTDLMRRAEVPSLPSTAASFEELMTWVQMLQAVAKPEEAKRLAVLIDDAGSLT